MKPPKTLEMKIKPDSGLDLPPMYQIFLLNDDHTPMDFVVAVLQKFFQMTLDQSHQLIWEVHHCGRGICGVYRREIAEIRVVQVNEYVREHQHSLLCGMEVIAQ